jgi:hypothetical protein
VREDHVFDAIKAAHRARIVAGSTTRSPHEQIPVGRFQACVAHCAQRITPTKPENRLPAKGRLKV